MVVARVVEVDAGLVVEVVGVEQPGGAAHSQIRALLRRRAQAFGGAAVPLVGGLREQAEMLAQRPSVEACGEGVSDDRGDGVFSVLP